MVEVPVLFLLRLVIFLPQLNSGLGRTVSPHLLQERLDPARLLDVVGGGRILDALFLEVFGGCGAWSRFFIGMFISGTFCVKQNLC